MATTVQDHPRYAPDVFSPEALRDPFPHYRAIRDAGPMVRLSNPDMLALARFQDVQAALRAPAQLINGEGVGFNDVVNAPPPVRGVLVSDGERHQRLRAVLNRHLAPAALKETRALLKDMMAAKVDSIGKGETFDAVSMLAQHLPLEAISVLVGLPDESREKMLSWGSAFFHFTGLTGDMDNLPPEDAKQVVLVREVMTFLATVDPKRFAPGSWSERLFQSIEQGKLTEPEARGALRAFVLPSLDTTIYSKANLLYNLANDAAQWAKLKTDPKLITSAILEGVRHSAVVRWFSRYAAEDYSAGDVFVPKGERVMLIYASANRDERHYANPDRFDVTRNPTDQLGWGSGPHMCVGMGLAKLEMEILLETLLERVERFEVDAPTYGINRGLYGIDALPMRLY